MKLNKEIEFEELTLIGCYARIEDFASSLYYAREAVIGYKALQDLSRWNQKIGG